MNTTTFKKYMTKTLAITLTTTSLLTGGAFTNLANAQAATTPTITNTSDTETQIVKAKADKGNAILENKIKAGGENQAINDYIDSLQYQKSSVLASEVDEAKGASTKTEMEVKNKTMIVTHKEAKSLENQHASIATINANMANIYPGALLLANEGLVNGQPTSVMCRDRAPVTVSVDLNGAGKDGSMVVDNPTKANVQAAIDSMIEKWAQKGHPIVADSEYKETMVSSSSQIEAALGVKDAADTLGLDMKAIHKGEKKAMVVSFRQVYFNVSVERGSDLFGQNTKLSDIKKNVTNDAPPVIVSNVSYGRMIYVVLETSSTSDEVEAAFKATLDGTKVEASAKYKSILENTSFTAYIFGGTASGACKKMVKKDMAEIRNLIDEEANYAGPEKSAAFPISYTTNFVKDNAPAIVKDCAKYIETTFERVTETQVNLKHSGAYVVKKWYVSAQEIKGYDDKGNQILGDWKTFYSDKRACAGDNASFTIPANYTNYQFGFDIAWGSNWPYRGVFCTGHAGSIDIKVWGTVRNAGYYVKVDGNQVARRR